jgi:hypothetical protein
MCPPLRGAWAPPRPNWKRRVITIRSGTTKGFRCVISTSILKGAGWYRNGDWTRAP